MDTNNWIFTALSGIILILYIVSSIIKNKIFRRITSFALLPVTGILATSFLVKYYPDSIHITMISIVSYFALSLSVIFIEFDKRRIFYTLGMVLSYIACLIWSYLFYTIFYLYHIPQAMLTVSIIIYVTLMITTFIFIGKQKVRVYFVTALSFIISSIMHYCSFITMCYEKQLYGILLYTGSCIMLGFFIYMILDRYKFHFKHSVLLKFVLPVAAQILISISSIVMIH